MTRLEIAARIAAGLAKDDFAPVSVIAERSLRMADELIRLEAETRPKPEPEPEQELPFEIVVGGVYVDREGREEEIVGFNRNNPTPFKGKSGRTYTRNGGFYVAQKSKYDLIKRIQ